MSVIAFDPFFPTSYRVLTTEDRGKNNRNISVTGTHTWSRSPIVDIFMAGRSADGKVKIPRGRIFRLGINIRSINY